MSCWSQWLVLFQLEPSGAVPHSGSKNRLGQLGFFPTMPRPPTPEEADELFREKFQKVQSPIKAPLDDGTLQEISRLVFQDDRWPTAQRQLAMKDLGREQALKMLQEGARLYGCLGYVFEFLILISIFSPCVMVSHASAYKPLISLDHNYACHLDAIKLSC